LSPLPKVLPDSSTCGEDGEAVLVAGNPNSGHLASRREGLRGDNRSCGDLATTSSSDKPLTSDRAADSDQVANSDRTAHGDQLTDSDQVANSDRAANSDQTADNDQVANSDRAANGNLRSYPGDHCERIALDGVTGGPSRPASGVAAVLAGRTPADMVPRPCDPSSESAGGQTKRFTSSCVLSISPR
jgi:hypothetical protein